jgi:hypothetical protein
MEALASRLGVLAKNKKRVRREGGGREEGPVGRIITLLLPTVTFARTPSL